MTALEPTAVTPPPGPYPPVQAFVVPRDVRRSELDTLAQKLAHLVPGRYEVDWVAGILRLKDGQTITGGCVVLVGTAENGPWLFITENVHITELRRLTDLNDIRSTP